MDTHDETDKNVDAELEVETLKTSLLLLKNKDKGLGIFFSQSIN